MDVMTAKMRAFKFSQKSSRKPKDKNVSDSLTLDKSIVLTHSLPGKNEYVQPMPRVLSGVEEKNMPSEEILKAGVRQKNIQLRVDQIKSLREYTFKSGDLKGAQLNESQICRVALDLFFWLNINPSSVETEEELLALVKKSANKV